MQNKTYKIKCIVIKEFTLSKFNELRNIKRINNNFNEKNKLYKNDEFECDEEMAKYLTGNNSKNEIVVKVIEIA